MIVVGAKGLAKELLQVFADSGKTEHLYFFDDVSDDVSRLLYDKFPVLRSFEEVKAVFQRTGDYSFALGLGNPLLRSRMATAFTGLKGKLTSVISTGADVGTFGDRKSVV